MQSEDWDALANTPGSGFILAPKISSEEASSLPTSFQAADAWPQCSKVGVLRKYQSGVLLVAPNTIT
jgi:hypothetical protein